METWPYEKMLSTSWVLSGLTVPPNKCRVGVCIPWASRSPWIFPGDPLKGNGAPGNIHGNLTAPRVCQCPTGLCSKQWVNHTTSLWWVKLPWKYGWINHMNLPRTKCKQKHTKHTSKTLSKSYGMFSAPDVPVPNTCNKHTFVCMQMLHGPSADTVLTIKLHVLSGKFLWEKVFRFTLNDQMGS